MQKNTVWAERNVSCLQRDLHHLLQRRVPPLHPLAVVLDVALAQQAQKVLGLGSVHLHQVISSHDLDFRQLLREESR